MHPVENKNSHAKLSPSSSDRWMECPGSIQLSEGIPSTTSKYAEEGTYFHGVVAAKLLTGKYPSDCFDAYTEDAEEQCNQYVQYVDALKSAARGEMFIEQKVSLEAIDPDCYGTADALIYDKTKETLHVIDFKWGMGISVEATDNAQMKCYALGAVLSLPHLKVNNVVMTIVQPRAFHPDGPIRSTAMDVCDLLEFSSQLKTYAQATRDKNPKLSTGDHCRFCPAAGICPEFKKQANDLAKLDFKTIAKYDAEELGVVMSKLPILEDWIKSVREFAFAEMSAGKPIPGWKLVPKRAMRKWVSENQVLEVLTSMGYSPNEITDTKLKSPAQMEKALKAEKHILNDLVVAESSGLTLAPETDKRAAADPYRSAALDFNNVKH